MGSIDVCNQDELRTAFSKAMSKMYQDEVPLYAELLQTVTDVNRITLRHPILDLGDLNDESIDRITLERHGAIRLGTALELSTVGRLFAQFGMFPVGYYDLSIAGLPMHATAFRPLRAEALQKNPFRIFTTVLRPELLSEKSRSLSQAILPHRRIFSEKLLVLLDEAESLGGVMKSNKDIFITETLTTFRWQGTAVANHEDYLQLKMEHPILADVVSFPTAHINHLTPRTLDIDLAQSMMRTSGLDAKERIEGPPRRNCQILLRQTSFKALYERVDFPSSPNGAGVVNSVHSARFGEIEQRGCALSVKGRALYDRLLTETSTEATNVGADGPSYDKILAEVFQQFPDDPLTLQAQDLIFCTYYPTDAGLNRSREASGSLSISIPDLLKRGWVGFKPIIYEDFLPFSAAGIFQSNLGTSGGNTMLNSGKPDQQGFEKCLGQRTIDPFALYSGIQEKSVDQCYTTLGLSRIR